MREHIKYCPRCGSQELDFTAFGSDGHVLCIDCKTHFIVQSIRLDTQPAPPHPSPPPVETP